MPAQNQHLRAIVDRLGLSNAELSRKLGIDPSLVSRYLSGERALRAASPQMDAIATYVLTYMERTADTVWLTRRFAEAGLHIDSACTDQMKQALVFYLASDGAALMLTLGLPVLAQIKRDAPQSDP